MERVVRSWLSVDPCEVFGRLQEFCGLKTAARLLLGNPPCNHCEVVGSAYSTTDGPTGWNREVWASDLHVMLHGSPDDHPMNGGACGQLGFRWAAPGRLCHFVRV
jgi:hypothetical protein